MTVRGVLIALSATLAAALSTQRKDGAHGQLNVDSPTPPTPILHGRGNAEVWPPACTPENGDKYQYGPPPDPGIACCEDTVACIEDRPDYYPGFGEPGMEKVFVCRSKYGYDCVPEPEPSTA